ncbi:MAG: hypothetical protein RDV41_06705 [Planctomycetota bacterium]|nr:hypothetical protein [Planctomycetota bacterium]
MDAVTYPDPTVAEFVQRNVVPLRVRWNDEKLAPQFNVKWTPTLVTLDEAGKEHHRTTGFMPPEELVSSLMLGIGKTHFDLDRHEEAATVLASLVAGFPKSGSAPEALFTLGVAGYKAGHDPGRLKQAYERLAAEYPASEWTKRALPYRLL